MTYPSIRPNLDSYRSARCHRHLAFRMPRLFHRNGCSLHPSRDILHQNYLQIDCRWPSLLFLHRLFELCPGLFQFHLLCFSKSHPLQ